MSHRKYVAELSSVERKQLRGLISKGKAASKVILKARILLKSDQGRAGPGWSDERVCEALDTNGSMVILVRRQLVEEGLETVLAPKKRKTPPIQPIFGGERQARLRHWRVARRPMATHAGASACWPTRWWSWGRGTGSLQHPWTGRKKRDKARRIADRFE